MNSPAEMLHIIAQLENANRSLAADLIAARTSNLRDHAMFAKLESLAAEFDTEAKGLIDDTGAKLNAIEAKFTSALASIKGARESMKKPSTSVDLLDQETETATTSTVTVSQPTAAPAGIITVTGDVATGSTISGPGVDATATAVADGPAVGQTTVTLSDPTTADRIGGETLTVILPAAS